MTSPKDGLFSPTPNTATKETKHGLIIVDAIDADLLASAGATYTTGGGPYARISSRDENGRYTQPYLHRVIVERMTGAPIPKGMTVDHINHDALDNRRANLRVCTPHANQQNQNKRTNNTSGYKGVSFHKVMKCYRAIITANKQTYFLGYFDTPEQAHAAYVAAARELHGEYANDGRGCLILSDGGAS